MARPATSGGVDNDQIARNAGIETSKLEAGLLFVDFVMRDEFQLAKLEAIGSRTARTKLDVASALKRFADAAEVAAAVCYLASPQAASPACRRATFSSVHPAPTSDDARCCSTGSAPKAWWHPIRRGNRGCGHRHRKV